MENNMEKIKSALTEQDYIITRIPIYLKSNSEVDEAGPHFFLKWFKKNKRFRVSISFKYLYKKWGFRVNVIRDPLKIDPVKLEFLYKLVKDDAAKINKINYVPAKDFIGFQQFIDKENQTEIFIFGRVFGQDENKIIVFLSTNFWSIQEYLEFKVAAAQTGATKEKTDV
jgi:hypothetical protein